MSIAADMLFLQETYKRHSEPRRLRCSWISQVFQSSFSSRARGEATLVRKSVPFKHMSMISDPNGRYVIVSGLLSSIHVTLLDVYGPHFDDPTFFRKVFNLLPTTLNSHLIIGDRDGNSSLRLGLESHLSRINKDLGLDLDS